LLYNSFLDRFSHFKRNPNLFLNDLSQEIVKTLSKEPEHVETTVDELRKTTLVFLETALSKLIWCPDDSVETWNSVKKISEQLAKLVDHKILGDSEDLNDLYVTLLERYCFFIDLASNHLPVSFYEEIKKDISAKKPALLSLAEQDEMIETKETRLRRTLAQGEQYARQVRQKELLDSELKGLAQNHGILLR
jgi:6-pyruvoyl-tetrahydropterin synthase